MLVRLNPTGSPAPCVGYATYLCFGRKDKVPCFTGFLGFREISLLYCEGATFLRGLQGLLYSNGLILHSCASQQEPLGEPEGGDSSVCREQAEVKPCDWELMEVKVNVPVTLHGTQAWG